VSIFPKVQKNTTHSIWLGQ